MALSGGDRWSEKCVDERNAGCRAEMTYVSGRCPVGPTMNLCTLEYQPYTTIVPYRVHEGVPGIDAHINPDVDLPQIVQQLTSWRTTRLKSIICWTIYLTV